MAQTAMAAAFTKAGHKTPEERLEEIARDAWAKWSMVDGGSARRDYVKGQLVAEHGDVLWELLQQYRPGVLAEAVGMLLARTADMIAAAAPERQRQNAGKPAGGGQEVRDTQSMCAPATSSGGKPVSGRGRVAVDTHSRNAPAAPPASHAATIAAKTAVMRRLSQLDLVIVNGQPLAKVRVDEARGWAMKHGATSRFILSVTANMPDHWVVGDHVPPDLADELYARAEAEYAAAA
jgi:hypothetical protein